MNPLKRFWQIYQSLAQMAILNQFQYRVAHYFYTIGMITEPVVYLVVWTTIANARGSAVGGSPMRGVRQWGAILPPSLPHTTSFGHWYGA